MSTTITDPPIVEESAIARRVFAETGPASIAWLIVRLYLGYEWLVAGWDKVTDTAWMGGGAASEGFAAGAIERGAGGDHPAIAYSWYVNFLEWIRDSAHAWMAPLVAVGEVETIHGDHPLGVAVDRLVAADVRHLVVIDAARRPIGVVSARDVMRHVVSTGSGVS